MKNTCFKSERRPAMTDYPLILGENVFFSNTSHQNPRDVVLNFDFKRKLNSRCSYGENVVRILILRARLRAQSLLFSKKKKKEMPTYLLKFWIWKNGNQEIFLSWPKWMSENLDKNETHMVCTVCKNKNYHMHLRNFYWI